MIETMDGINNLDEILTTPGLDGVYIGPSDLALALGLPPQGDTDHPVHAEHVKRILDGCKANRVAAGIHTSSLEYAQRYLQMGFNFVTLGADAGFMGRAAAQDLAAARGTQQEEREKTGY
jgi:4-hydroxy-2-oxoheptanedioate aldolase